MKGLAGQQNYQLTSQHDMTGGDKIGYSIDCSSIYIIRLLRFENRPFVVSPKYLPLLFEILNQNKFSESLV